MTTLTDFTQAPLRFPTEAKQGYINQQMIERILSRKFTPEETEQLHRYLYELYKAGDRRLVESFPSQGYSIRVNGYVVGVGTYGNGKEFKAFCFKALVKDAGEVEPVSSRWELDEPSTTVEEIGLLGTR